MLARAKTDLRSMYSFIAKRSPDGADRWESAFHAGARRLQTNPFSCGIAPENELVTFELRQLFFKTPHGRRYRAVFTIDGDQVVILRLRGPGQAPLSEEEVS